MIHCLDDARDGSRLALPEDKKPGFHFLCAQPCSERKTDRFRDEYDVGVAISKTTVSFSMFPAVTSMVGSAVVTGLPAHNPAPDIAFAFELTLAIKHAYW